jgi:xanthine dehydrogenase molybdopterin-binding subunit B
MLDADLVKVSGEFEIGSQYHFHMETQSVIVRPVEDFQVKISPRLEMLTFIGLGEKFKT